MLSELWRARLTGALVATVVAAPLGVPGIVLAAGSGSGGANSGCGAYCPTTPAPGDENQGNGNAPANGSVGNADSKNPPGQAPDGTDSNSGYECDTNKGVGDKGGNPAHTGCASTVIPVQGNGAAGLALAALSVPVFGGVLYVMNRRRRDADSGSLA